MGVENYIYFIYKRGRTILWLIYTLISFILVYMIEFSDYTMGRMIGRAWHLGGTKIAIYRILRTFYNKMDGRLFIMYIYYKSEYFK